MSRDRPTRLDLNTEWLSSPRVRALARAYPTDWPAYWVAYLLLLSKVWSMFDRSITLHEAFSAVIPCDIDSAVAALARVGLIDAQGCIPEETFSEWVVPAIESMRRSRAHARMMSERRWAPQRNAAGTATSTSARTSASSPTGTNEGNAPPANPPTRPPGVGEVGGDASGPNVERDSTPGIPPSIDPRVRPDQGVNGARRRGPDSSRGSQSETRETERRTDRNPTRPPGTDDRPESFSQKMARYGIDATLSKGSS